MDLSATPGARGRLAPENLLLYLLPRRGTPVAVRYAATAVIVAAFVALQFVLSATVVNWPFLLFILPVFLASLLFDRGSGFLATALAALAANAFFVGSAHWILPDSPRDAAGTILFLVAGLSIATLTEILRKTLEQVAQSERERALLLKELNHRIRNDLQMVAALLNLSTRLDDSRGALTSAADRVNILSDVYRTLSERDDSPQLPAPQLIENLVGSFRSRLMGMRPISITTEVEPIEITTRCATALSLMVNELVTNALKHAFPGDRQGTITVGLRRAANSLELAVADDGIGIEGEPQPGFGSRLVRQLAAQHGGSVRRETDAGRGLRAVVDLPATCIVGAATGTN